MNRHAYSAIFLLGLLHFCSLWGAPHSTHIKQLSIKSLKQELLDKDRVCFTGEVEVWIDEKLQIWADFVEVNKKQQTLYAQANNGSSIKIENNDFVILAERFFLNLLNKTGRAEKIRFHVDEGFLSAKHAQKSGENEWQMIDMIYTPCDAQHPHWNLSAGSAQVHGGYFIKACNITFKIGGVPVFYLPRMIFPIQGRSKSGFLIPRFYFDYVYGFGFKQEYYKYFGPHCDTTISIDWRDKRGLVFSDEFRWALSPENFLNFKGQYAIARDSFVQKKDKIFKATDHRYWIQGTDFRSSTSVIPDALLASLIRLDFGTDKKIGYHFFNTTDDVDDEFYNSGHIRLLWPGQLVEWSCAQEKTSRRQFFSVSQDQLEALQSQSTAIIHNSTKEVEDSVHLTYLPRIEWNSAYTIWKNFFSYRHDFFIDQVTSWQQEREQFFLNGVLAQENILIPSTKSDLLRANYRADIREAFSIHDNTLSCWINPNLQFRSHVRSDAQNSKNVFERRVLGHGAFRFFLTAGAEWALPEGVVINEFGTYSYFLQPLVRWELTPKFEQKHWNYFDRWDRAYPENQISFILRNSISCRHVSFDWQLSQGYDFYDRSDIFFLKRGTFDNHLLPIRIDGAFQCKGLNVAAIQEYEWRNGRLLQSEISINFEHNKFMAGCGYLFQRKELQNERMFIANIPHFLTFNAMLPITKRLTLSYDGQFYAEYGPKIFAFSTIRPLLHRIRLEYNGHCWGFCFGFEEKKYRDSGNWKQERAMVLSIRLDSLGSFAQKFRQPQIVRVNGDRL